MKAATASKSSFMQGDQLHVQNVRAPKKLMHSQSAHLPCRFQAPSATTCLNICNNRRLTRDGWLSERRMRRSKIECQSSLVDTFPPSTTTTITTSSTTSIPSTTTTITSTYNHTRNDPPMSTFTRRREHDEVGMQELTVYEVNEGDRNSPMLLFSSKLAVDWYNRLTTLGGLGDFILFTNKTFDGSLKKRLGITAGMITLIRPYPKENGFLYEAVYSFYFGDFGHISVKGHYKTHKDTILTVTGGSGIFKGVYGTVELRNIEFPTVLFYTFNLYGIAQLPKELIWEVVPPTKGVRPSRNASLLGVALRNFTD